MKPFRILCLLILISLAISACGKNKEIDETEGLTATIKDIVTEQLQDNNNETAYPNESESTDEQESSSTAESGYPIEVETPTEQDHSSSIDSAYPDGNEEESENEYYVSEIVIPTPTGDTGVVFGTLRLLSQENSPYLAPSLYLGNFLQSNTDSDNVPAIGSISIEEDPKAIQAENGDFLFEQVPPGEYGLFIWTPASAFLLKDAKTNEPVRIEVKANQSHDLGTIYVP